MTLATNTPQNLLDGLRALVMTLMAERDFAISERDALAEQNDRTRHLLLKLKRMQFGAKFERLPDEQLQLGLEALEQAAARGDAEAEKRDTQSRQEGAARRRANRGALPAHLPRTHVTLAPEDTNCPCCRAAMTVIGEDTSERLDVIPAHFRVLVTHRPKLICRSCAGPILQRHGYAACKKHCWRRDRAQAIYAEFDAGLLLEPGAAWLLRRGHGRYCADLCACREQAFPPGPAKAVVLSMMVPSAVVARPAPPAQKSGP